MMAKLKILVVDNWIDAREGLIEVFKHPPESIQDLMAKFGNVEIVVEDAKSSNSAIKKIENARKEGANYNILILDLRLVPEDCIADNQDKTLIEEEPEEGIRVLKAIRPSDFTACVVTSAVRDYDAAIQLFEHPVTAFIPKSAEIRNIDFSESLWQTAISAWRKMWLQCQYHESELRIERVNWTLKQSKEELADLYSSLISSKSSDLLKTFDEITGQLNDRFMINFERDSEDPLIQRLDTMKKIIGSLAIEAANLRGTPLLTKENFRMVNLVEMCKKIKEKYSAALLFHQVRFTFPEQELSEYNIETFSDDLQSIIEEVVFGTIRSYPKCDVKDVAPSRNIDISFESKEGKMYITIKDNSVEISEKTREQLRNNEHIDPKDERGWGLSLANRMAYNMGVRLEIGPSKAGNIIIIRIPINKNA